MVGETDLLSKMRCFDFFEALVKKLWGARCFNTSRHARKAPHTRCNGSLEEMYQNQQKETLL